MAKSAIQKVATNAKPMPYGGLVGRFALAGLAPFLSLFL
jgi:hypothetical protein